MNYPIHQPSYLPHALARLGLLGAMYRDLYRGGIDPTLVMSALIAIVTLLTQGQAYMLWPNGLHAPIGANFFMVAPRVSGKSLLLKILLAPIYEYLASYQPKEGDLEPDFFIEDASPEVLVHDLKAWPIRLALYEEGRMFEPLLKSSKAQAKLIKLSDGTLYRSSRVGMGSTTLQGHACKFNCYVQDDEWPSLKPYLSGGVGYQNRNFFFYGGRVISQQQANQTYLSEPVLQSYKEAISRCLMATIAQVKEGPLNKKRIPHRPDAERFLAYRYNMPTHHGMTPMQAEYFARGQERSRGLGTSFSVFERGVSEDVDLAYAEAAAAIDQLSTDYYSHLTYVPPAVTPALILENFLYQSRYQKGVSRVRLCEIKDQALNMGLIPSQINKAVAELVKQGKVYVERDDSARWINYHGYLIP